MANRTNEAREQLIEQAEQLYIMGVRTPTELQRNLAIEEWTTAKKYLDIVRRRIRHRYGNTRMYKKQLTKELASLDYMEKRAWADYLAKRKVKLQKVVDGKIINTEEEREQDDDTKVRIMANILKIQERRAALLGMDAPKASMIMQFTKDLETKQLGRRLSDDELKELTGIFTRINDELISHTQRKAAAKDVPGAQKSIALRPGVPEALPDQPSTPVSPAGAEAAAGKPADSAGRPA